MAKKRLRRKPEADVSEIPMTPMIDVVFQLLIYFLVTMKPVDVIAHLDVFRPSPEAQKEETQTPPKLIRVVVYSEGFTINERPVGLVELDRLLTKLASYDNKQTLLIMCTAASSHDKLVRLLDLCSKAGLTNLSVVSTN